MSKGGIKLLMAVIGLGVVIAAVFWWSRKEDTMIKNSSVTIPAVDRVAPAQTQRATLALGCFWGPDGRFGSTPGVIRTRVGYAGGTLENPSYYKLGDHTETIQLDYDPAQISYEELLAIFWESDSSAHKPFSRQYAPIIFYHNEEQRKLAAQSKALQEAECDCQLYTEILPFEKFYLAEAYHQKYRLLQTPEFAREFKAIYPDADDFVNSTAAARVNGYLSGYGTLSALRAEIDGLGLSPAMEEKLLAIVERE